MEMLIILVLIFLRVEHGMELENRLLTMGISILQLKLLVYLKEPMNFSLRTPMDVQKQQILP